MRMNKSDIKLTGIFFSFNCCFRYFNFFWIPTAGNKTFIYQNAYTSLAKRSLVIKKKKFYFSGMVIECLIFDVECNVT